MLQEFRLDNFKGLNQVAAPRLSPGETRFIQNAHVQFGKVTGRQGLATLEGISSAAADPIIGLFVFQREDLTSTLVRFTIKKIETLNEDTNAWDDITGTDLTAGDSTIISATIIEDNLLFVDDGADAVRKWTGSGNTANIGGSPPTAKRIIAFEEFVFLGNLTNAPSQIRFSDDWDNTWTSTDVINLRGTEGTIQNWMIMGRLLYIYLTDAIVTMEFTGGPLQFAQRKFPSSVGCLAPMSLQSIEGLGHIFLATDRNLYLNNGQSITLLSDKFRDVLLTTALAGWLPLAASTVDTINGVYSLFVNTTTSGQWHDTRIDVNYRSGEISRHVYGGHAIKRLAPFYRFLEGDEWSGDSQLWSADSTDWISGVGTNQPITVVATDDKKVYRLDSGADDDGTAVERFFQTDWQDFQVSTKKFLASVDVEFARADQATVSLDLAVDNGYEFRHLKSYSLSSPNAQRDDTIISYAPGVLGSVFNLRIKMHHNVAANVADIKSITFYYKPISSASNQASLGQRGQRSR